MATIEHYNTHSTIQILKDIYFVFGNLEKGENDMEKLKFSINAFNNYFSVLGEDAPIFHMDWKQGEEGDWVVSDDMRIVQILRKTVNDQKGAYNKAVIRTCVGTFAVNPQTYFDTDFELHPDRYRISTHKKENHERIFSRENPTVNEKHFASRVAQGENPQDAYMKVFPTTNEKYAKDMSNVLMKQERINKKISSEVELLLEEEGVSKRYIIRKYKELIDDGLLDLKNCSASVRAALADLAKMSAMEPDKTTQTAQGAFAAIEEEKLTAIDEAEEKAHRRLSTPDEPDIPEQIEIEEDSLLSEVGKGLLS